MKRTNWRFVIALAACTLLPAIVAQAQDKVLRPLKMQAQSQQVWQLDTEGVPVNCIRVDGWGVSSGFITGANGDQIFYAWPAGDPLDVTITGGTGRFSEATGKFTVRLLSVMNSVDPKTGILTISLTWTASGSISY